MSSTATNTPAALPAPGDQIKAFIASGAWYRQVTGLLALAGVIALGLGLIMFASKPSYVPVYQQLTQQDALTVTDMLRSENIPFKLEAGSGRVLVPADQLESVKLKLAAAGVNGNAQMGIEILQKDQGLGTSHFIETARYHHAQETELSRTISSMRNIDTARVHLALPKQSVFIRNRAKPTASVLVKLMPGRSLEAEQIASIVHIVASSIPYLASSDVTIVDQFGRLLSSEDNDGLGLSTKQFDFTRKLENSYASRVEELLTPILGEGKVRAKVNAEVDFTYNESTREAYDGDPQRKLRSEQTQEQTSTGAAGALGIPGALTNQPPGAGTTDPNQAGGGANAQPKNASAQATRNYELDRTITHSKASTGQLKRLSVAVLVDDNTTVNEAGETVKEPLTAEQITTLTNIVKEAIGFDEARGDSVAVFNQSFKPAPEIEPISGPPLWEQPWLWGLVKQILIGVAAILLVLFVAKPAVKSLKAAPARPGLEDQTEELENVSLTEAGGLKSDTVSLSQKSAGGGQSLPSPPHAYGDVLNVARGLAAEDPKRVAKVIKDWVNDNA
ncbi:MAG: flagellar basal-body MS-ring/collar protein FliF [Thiotrichales bacterium]